MYPITKEEMKNLRFVLSDPDVSEERWLAACEVLGGRDIVGKRSVSSVETPIWREKTGWAQVFSICKLGGESVLNAIPLILAGMIMVASTVKYVDCLSPPDWILGVISAIGVLSLFCSNYLVKRIQDDNLKSSTLELLKFRVGLGVDLANLAFYPIALFSILIIALYSGPLLMPMQILFWMVPLLMGFIFSVIPSLCLSRSMPLRTTLNLASANLLLCLPHFCSLFAVLSSISFLSLFTSLFCCSNVSIQAVQSTGIIMGGFMALLFTGYVAGILLPSWYFAWRNRRAWRRFIEGE